MIKRSAGMGQDSTAKTPKLKIASELGGPGTIEQHADSSTPRLSSELPTEPYLVELSLIFGGEEGRFEFQSSIEVRSYQEGLGIFRELSAYILNIASRDQ
jgi:hypothetical protein